MSSWRSRLAAAGEQQQRTVLEPGVQVRLGLLLVLELPVQAADERLRLRQLVLLRGQAASIRRGQALRWPRRTVGRSAQQQQR